MVGLSITELVRATKRVDTIVTRPVTDWLIKHGNDAHSPVTAAWVADQLSTPPRIRSGSFSGAAAGMCLRRQELAYYGAPGGAIDTQLQNIFNDGKWRHLRWQAMLFDAGVITDAEYLVTWDEYLSRGSLDARGEVPVDHQRRDWQGKEFGFELKGVSSFQYGRLSKEGPMLKHLQQIAHYFVLSNLDLFSVVYEDKTTQAWTEWVIEPDKKLMIEAESDIRALATAAKQGTLHGQLPDCVRRKGDIYNDCPYGNNGTCAKGLAGIKLGRKP